MGRAEPGQGYHGTLLEGRVLISEQNVWGRDTEVWFIRSTGFHGLASMVWPAERYLHTASPRVAPGDVFTALGDWASLAQRSQWG